MLVIVVVLSYEWETGNDKRKEYKAQYATKALTDNVSHSSFNKQIVIYLRQHDNTKSSCDYALQSFLLKQNKAKRDLCITELI